MVFLGNLLLNLYQVCYLKNKTNAIMNHHVAITQFQLCYIYIPPLLNPTISPQIILKQIKNISL